MTDHAGVLEIGVIGLGAMGSAAVGSLLAAGHRVGGYDLDPDRAAPLVAAGMTGLLSAAAVAASCDIVLTLLPSTAALVATGEAIAEGVGQRPHAGGPIVAEMSTLRIADKEAFRDRLEPLGATVLDCPISGTAAQARRRDLVFYASGPAEPIDVLRPFLAAMGRATHRIGDFGDGSKMKFVANLLVTIHNVAAAEALVLAERVGLDPAQTLELLADGAGGSRMLQVRGPMMVSRDYLPATMSLALYRKDLTIIDAFAREHATPTPLFATATQVYEAAFAEGMGDLDTAAVHAELRRMAGLGRPEPA